MLVSTPYNLFQSSAVAAVVRYQILDGHTVNRGVETGGAELHKSQNIGWASTRVPTEQIRSCNLSIPDKDSPLQKAFTVSTLLQPRGSIFQNGFLGGVQFKFSSKFTSFLPIFDLRLGF